MRKLTKLRIDEVSAVDKSANPGSKILFWKRDNGDAVLQHDDGAFSYLPSWALPPQRSYRLFNDIINKVADVNDPYKEPRAAEDDVPDDYQEDVINPKLHSMVAALIVALPSLTEEKAMHFILHTPHGRRMYEHFSKAKDTSMLDIAKVIAITEQALLARAPEPREFAKLYENDIEFRKQWRDLTEAKHLLALQRVGKGTATLTPTSVEVGNTNVADDSAEAIRLLREMAEEQHKTFEQVFSAPENRKLAARTYTSHHRSSTSGSELQGDSWARE